MLNGTFYVLWTGCQWKALPKDLPPKSTVHDYLELWNWDDTLERIHHALYVAVREEEGREASPTVGRGSREGRSKRGSGLDPSGYDAGKKIKSRKRHILVDTLGLLLNVAFIPPIFRTTTAPSTCCAGHDDYFRSSKAFLLTAETRDARWR